MLDEEVINYGPGQSLLTTVDLPVISHVTRASVHEPVLALVLSQNIDAGRAGGLVGYESPSQFSREYSRLFGAPASRRYPRAARGQR